MTLAWQFAQLDAAAQRACITRMSTDGLGVHDIAEITGCGVEAVRAIAEHVSTLAAPAEQLP
jgi:hypothetical protein